jgi:hypothetical protein
LVDARDLKSRVLRGTYRFDSDLRHSFIPETLTVLVFTKRSFCFYFKKSEIEKIQKFLTLDTRINLNWFSESKDFLDEVKIISTKLKIHSGKNKIYLIITRFIERSHY